MLLLPFNSPCPILPKRPMTTLHGKELICTSPKHHSQSFWRPSLRAEPFFLRALQEERRENKTKTQLQQVFNATFRIFLY